MLPCPAVAAPPDLLVRSPTKQARTGGTAATAMGCLGTLVVCAALGYWAYRNLPPAKPHASAVPQILAGLIGVFGGLGLTSLYYLLRGHGAVRNRGTCSRSGPEPTGRHRTAA